MEERKMKKIREMMNNKKKNNKGFSLVELIVVIAIMAVLIGVLGSTILGYVEKSKYSKDLSALDSINTAIKTFVAEPNSEYTDGTEYTLTQIMNTTNMDKGNVVAPILSEVFDTTASPAAFNESSDAFKDITADNVKICIEDGAVSILVESKDEDYADYTVGKHEFTGAPAGGEGESESAS